MKYKKIISKKWKTSKVQILQKQQKIRKTQPLWKVTSVHKDVSDRLLKINPILAKEVREILNENKAERHLRGGMATKLKYLKEKEEKKASSL